MAQTFAATLSRQPTSLESRPKVRCPYTSSDLRTTERPQTTSKAAVSLQWLELDVLPLETLLSRIDVTSTNPSFSFGDQSVVAARQASDAATMNRFPTNKFTSSATITPVRDGTMQILIREIIITSGSTHSSSLYYAGRY